MTTESRTIGSRPCVRTVNAHGEIDLATEDALRARIVEAMEGLDDGGTLVINLSAVTFMGTSGARCIAVADTELTPRKGTVVISEPAPQVLRFLQIVGLDHLVALRSDDNPLQRPGSLMPLGIDAGNPAGTGRAVVTERR